MYAHAGTHDNFNLLSSRSFESGSLVYLVWTFNLHRGGHASGGVKEKPASRGWRGELVSLAS
jgi:hypothetical protein